MKLHWVLICTLALSLTACITQKLIPCQEKAFQSPYSAAHLYTWGDDNQIKARELRNKNNKNYSDYCLKALKQQGAAYCKAPYDPVFRKGLQETASFCQEEALSLGITIQFPADDAATDQQTDAATEQPADAGSEN